MNFYGSDARKLGNGHITVNKFLFFILIDPVAKPCFHMTIIWTANPASSIRPVDGPHRKPFSAVPS